MQNAAFAALGLDWRYLAFEVNPAQLREAIAGASAMNFIGLNLTVPHKLLALEMVDVLDESARAWGAVNTIRFEGRTAAGEWKPLHHFPEGAGEVRSVGFNTDAEGLSRSLVEDLGLKIKSASVLLLGAGGAGRAAALKLAADGVRELFLVNRTRSKVEALIAEIGERFPGTRLVAGYPSDPNQPMDLLLNATSLGLKPHEGSPLDEQAFALKRARAVYDMIYRPSETPLLKAAKAAGCRTANGTGMLLYQGARALELWSGQPAPVEVMRRALLKNIYEDR